MTSSPTLRPQAKAARDKLIVPLLTTIQFFEEVKEIMDFSNSIVFLNSVIQPPDFKYLTIALISSFPKLLLKEKKMTGNSLLFVQEP